MPFPTRHILILWLVLPLCLSSCAMIAKQPDKPISLQKPSVLHKQHMAKITNIQHFTLKGRLGIIAKPKSHSARLSWQHQPEKDNIDIFSPLGGKVANITKTPAQVVLTDNDQKKIQAQDAETLTEETLGFRLPLSGLSHWALGRPSNTGIANVVIWDKNGRINYLKQNGWDIRYKNYTEKAGYFLPRKVTLKNERMTLKLVIDKWSGL